uniref:Uncharacterized protein n=1 Tax=Plectus sambesii TaxID=2011161 RepID=A0A914XBZ2_9BILA
MQPSNAIKYVQWVSIQSCCTDGDDTLCVVADGRECPAQQCAAATTAATRSLGGAGHASSAVYGGDGSGGGGASGWGTAEWTLTIGVPLLVALCILRALLRRHPAMASCRSSLVPRCLSDRCRSSTIRYDRRNQRVVGLSTALRDASTLTSIELDASSLNNTAPTHVTVLDQSTIVSHLHMMAGQPASCADPGYATFLTSLIEDANRTEEPEELKNIIAKAVIAYPRTSSPVI